LKNAAIEQFIGDNEAAEMLEWITEMREAEEESRRDEAAEKAYWEKAA